MESIISYFGTYTPAADGAIANFKFEYLCTLGFAAIVIFLGRAIVAHSAALRKYAIPAAYSSYMKYLGLKPRAELLKERKDPADPSAEY